MYRTDQNGQSQRRNAEGFRQNFTDEQSVSVLATISQQCKKSWLTVVIGLIMLVIGICILIWNEERAVRVTHSLNDALDNTVVIPNPMVSLPEYQGHLVYLSGHLVVSEPLTEPDYGIVISSVKLKRKVQMYQWIEIEEEASFSSTTEDEKHYYYTTEWKNKLVDSDDFYIRTGHHNPKEMLIKSQLQIADEVKIGVFTLGTELKKKFDDFVEVTSDERPERKDIKMHSGLYYHSADLWNPQVGDVRIQFSYAGKGGETYSVVGLLEKDVIKPYYTSHGEEILLERKHKISVGQMFHLEHKHNYWRTWAIRGLGWLVLFWAATCLTNILKTIILNSAFLCSIIAVESLTVSVSMCISLLAIAIAWVWCRPMICFCLVLSSFLLPFIYSIMTSGCISQRRNNYRRL